MFKVTLILVSYKTQLVLLSNKEKLKKIKNAPNPAMTGRLWLFPVGCEDISNDSTVSCICNGVYAALMLGLCSRKLCTQTRWWVLFHSKYWHTMTCKREQYKRILIKFCKCDWMDTFWSEEMCISNSQIGWPIRLTICHSWQIVKVNCFTASTFELEAAFLV